MSEGFTWRLSKILVFGFHHAIVFFVFNNDSLEEESVHDKLFQVQHKFTLFVHGPICEGDEGEVYLSTFGQESLRAEE